MIYITNISCATDLQHSPAPTLNYSPYSISRGAMKFKNTHMGSFFYCIVPASSSCPASQCPCHPALLPPHCPTSKTRFGLNLVPRLVSLEHSAARTTSAYQTLNSNVTGEQSYCPARNDQDFQTSRRQLWGVGLWGWLITEPKGSTSGLHPATHTL